MKVVMNVVVKVVIKVVDESCDEGGEWMILSCLKGFEDGRTDEWADICEFKVASATEKCGLWF